MFTGTSVNPSFIRSKTEKVARAELLYAGNDIQATSQDMLGGQDFLILPQNIRRKKGYDLNTKYSVAKKEALESFDWFIKAWKDNGWEISDKDYDGLKKVWFLAGAPFLSYTDPENPNAENYTRKYYTTSRKYDKDTGLFSDNDLFYIGSPDILALPNPNTLYQDANGQYRQVDPEGPWGMLDELGHALRFAYPDGLPGINVSGEQDLNVFIMADELTKLAAGKTIGHGFDGEEVFFSKVGKGRGLEFNETFQDSNKFILEQQKYGASYFDEGITNATSNPANYNEQGEFILRKALHSGKSGQALTADAATYSLASPALYVTLANIIAGTQVLDVNTIDKLSHSSFGKQLLHRLIYDYGVGQDDINYGLIKEGIEKKYYTPEGSDSRLVQYNQKITLDDERYKIAKQNEEKFYKSFNNNQAHIKQGEALEFYRKILRVQPTEAGKKARSYEKVLDYRKKNK